MAMVTIFNPTAQLIKASVRGANGRPVHVPLEGRNSSVAVEASAITQHTKQLVARGVLKLRKVPVAYVAPAAAVAPVGPGAPPKAPAPPVATVKVAAATPAQIVAASPKVAPAPAAAPAPAV